ncbi:MAG: hypothetical protein AAF127_09810 [Pseudomonadota bacterium]
MAATMLLPAFTLGPDSRGRDYRVLAHSPELNAAISEGGWSGDLAMIVAAWAKTDETEFAACLELPRSEGACLVIRGKRFAQGSLDRVARVNGVMISGAQIAEMQGRTELVFAQLPAPDPASDFGAAAITIKAAGEIPGLQPYEDFGLAWRPYVLLHEPDETRGEVLFHALASITPIGARIGAHTWSTSTQLPARGTIAPARSAHLMVGRDPPVGAGERFTVLDTAQAGWDAQADPQPPDNYHVFAQLQAMAQAHLGADLPPAIRDWTPDWAERPLGDSVTAAFDGLWSVFPVPTMLEALTQVAASGNSEARAAAGDVAGRYIQADMRREDDPLIFQTLTQAEPATRAFMLERLAHSLDIGDKTDEELRPIWAVIAGLGLEEVKGQGDASSSEVRALIGDAVVGLWESVDDAEDLSPDEFDCVLRALHAWPERRRAADFYSLATPEFFDWLIAHAPELVIGYSRRLLRLGPQSSGTTVAQMGAEHDHDELGLANRLLAMVVVANWLEPTPAGDETMQRLSNLLSTKGR